MFGINYDNLLKDRETPGFLKDLIRNIQREGHFVAGTWIKNASTMDLWSVIKAFELLKQDAEKGTIPGTKGTLPITVSGTPIILTDVLSFAEGLDMGKAKVVKTRSGLLESYIAIELLKRRGFDVDICYENMTLDEVKNPMDKNRPVVKSDCINSLIDSLPEKKMSVLDKSDLKEFFNDLSSNLSDKEVSDKWNNRIAQNPSLRKDLEGLIGKDISPEMSNIDDELDEIIYSDNGFMIPYDPETDGTLAEFLEKNKDLISKKLGELANKTSKGNPDTIKTSSSAETQSQPKPAEPVQRKMTFWERVKFAVEILTSSKNHPDSGRMET